MCNSIMDTFVVSHTVGLANTSYDWAPLIFYEVSYSTTWLLMIWQTFLREVVLKEKDIVNLKWAKETAI